MPLENSAQTAQDPSASAPLAESGERTAGEVAGKPETREGKALNALKEAEAEGNEAEPKETKRTVKQRKRKLKHLHHSAAQRFPVNRNAIGM